MSDPIQAFDAALSATEGEAEPVAWRVRPLGDKVWHLSNEAPRLGYEGQPLYASSPSAPAGVKEQAIAHAIDLEQCSLFVDSAPLKKSMTDAAAFLRALQPDTQAAAASAPAQADALPAGVDAVRPVNVMEGRSLIHIEDDETREALFSIPKKHRVYADLLWSVTHADPDAMKRGLDAAADAAGGYIPARIVKMVRAGIKAALSSAPAQEGRS